MLQHIYIRNYALFARTEVEFKEGLNILTGETGAGKSLLVGALGLITGKRADNSVVFVSDEKCVVEATFSRLSQKVQKRLDQFEDFDLEGAELIIRREINPSGKSRAFINDTPVSLQVLRQVSNWLLDMHSQHENQQLLSVDRQLELLDAYADCGEQVKDFGNKLKENEALLRQIKDLERKEQEARSQLDFLNFQINELSAANIQAEEEKGLEDELNLLQNAEEVREALGQATEVLYHQELSLYNQLSEVLDPLSKVSAVNSRIAENLERLRETQLVLKETAFAYQDLLESVESDPERLAFIEERLAVYHQLKLKYQVRDGAELVEKFEQLTAQLKSFENLESETQDLKATYSQQQETLIKLGLQIEKQRQAAKPKLEKAIHQLLSEVGFEKARFEVALERNMHPDGALQIDGQAIKAQPHGINKVFYLIQTNPGMPAGPLAQIASGGEIARVMLAIKAALAEKSEFPVLIFDEIDTGISGEIANKVGRVMQKLSQHYQILSITHLPQIAAKGHSHYQIYKRIENNQTTSDVVNLNRDGRIQELAKMLSGNPPTESAIQNARDLISAVQAG